MLRKKTFLPNLPPKTRQLFIVLGIITLAFFIFSISSIKDLLAPANLYETIVNPIPIVICIVGVIANILVLNGRTRLPSYLLMGAVFIGFILIAIFAASGTYTTVAELIIVIIPILIAIQALSEREFTWIVIITVLARSVIQILGTYKSSGPSSTLSSQTELVAQWATGIIAILFGLYVAFNLNNYPFRVKLILVLGLLTIIPASIITSLTSKNLETSLVSQANQNLVSSSFQLAGSIDTFTQTNLDIARTAAQDPALISYLSQPTTGQGKLLLRNTELDRVGAQTLLALLKKDPVNIISVKILDGFGMVQLSTNQAEIGKYEVVQDYFLVPFRNGISYVSPVIVSENGGGSINFSSSIRSAAGNMIGVLDIAYSASVLQQSIVRNSSKLGLNVSVMLLDENNIILAHSSAPNLIYKIINPIDNRKVSDLIFQSRLQNSNPGTLTIQMDGLTSGLENLSKSSSFVGNFEVKDSNTVQTNASPDQAGAAKLTTHDWYVITFVPQSTLLAPVLKQTQNVVFVGILISLIGIAIALGLTQVLVSPILNLTRTSEQISQGDINATSSVRTHDEIGILAQTFNDMTGRVRDLIGNLEQRVSERTQALERRAVQLQAAADVGSTAARIRDLGELLRQVTRLISQRFGFYHVGIFLLDDRGDFAVLRASNSEGGQRMLTRGHKLKVGQVGIVGYVTGSGQPRIALNVGTDSEFFNNPDLPTTQSEMALPLIVGGRILGALDIQSSQESAFTQEDITTLKVLADQIAISIENSRLFLENQMALDAAQRAYGSVSMQGWQRLLKEGLGSVGYISLAEDQVSAVSENPAPGSIQAIQTGQTVLEKNGKVLHLPVKIREQCIGAIRMEKPAGSNTWTPDAISLADALSSQLGATLESARLYTDIRKRAEREYLISEITSKLGASIRLDSIIRTAVEELGQAFGDSEVVLQVGDQTQRGKDRE
jgi:GAF domain-containing protein/HAMP domain-containing protein